MSRMISSRYYFVDFLLFTANTGFSRVCSVPGTVIVLVIVEMSSVCWLLDWKAAQLTPAPCTLHSCTGPARDVRDVNVSCCNFLSGPHPAQRRHHGRQEEQALHDRGGGRHRVRQVHRVRETDGEIGTKRDEQRGKASCSSCPGFLLPRTYIYGD